MRQQQKKSNRKTRAELNEEGRERQRQRKHRGHSAGSRSNVSEQNNTSGRSSQTKDPRIGSKKPIDLVVDVPAKEKKAAKTRPATEKQKLTPEKELAQLESDEKLDGLLERLEDGHSLTKEEQKYVDDSLDRIDELMTILGIELEDEPDEDERPSDIMQLLKRND
jgi:ribosome assembly protein YihI (activator of Der GTPase)